MKKGGILYSSGQLDCLSYYILIFPKLKQFLKGREIATKTFIPKTEIGFIIHRGSKEPALFISDLLEMRDSFLKLRVGKKLKETKGELSQKERLIWGYFVPRKLVEMHYACNNEAEGSPINRIFLDIDKGEEIDYKSYLKVVNTLVSEIKSDKKLKKLLSFTLKIIWTGKSIHLYLFLKRKESSSLYKRYFSFIKGSFTSKWAERISEKTGISVEAGHEKEKNKIILDSSGTPPGKLARCPYSLHLSSKGELNGVSVPLREKHLKEKGIISRLQNLTLEKAIEFS